MVTALSHIAKFDTAVAFIFANFLTDILSIVNLQIINAQINNSFLLNPS